MGSKAATATGVASRCAHRENHVRHIAVFGNGPQALDRIVVSDDLAQLLRPVLLHPAEEIRVKRRHTQMPATPCIRRAAPGSVKRGNSIRLPLESEPRDYIRFR